MVMLSMISGEISSNERVGLQGYGVNSYSSQFVFKSTRTHFGRFVLSLVNSYSYPKYDFNDIYHIS